MNLAAEEARRRRIQTKDPGVVSAVGGAVGGLAGTAFGGPIGEAIGTMIGGKLGHLVEKIIGFGDYRIQQNSLMKGGMSPAQVVNSSERRCDRSPSSSLRISWLLLCLQSRSSLLTRDR